jgi:2-(1,2-epoxy-1,2-dihydrophenyl)acetyl-CoA isomerase
MTTNAPIHDVLTVRRGAVATVTLNRPDAMNAVDNSMRRNLMAALDDLARSTEVRAVVLTGAGKAFCSGADLKSAAANPDTSLRRTARTLMHDFQPIVECMSRMDKPVIGAINGAAVGVGMSLALACDLLVMAESAYLLSPFVGIGLIPDGGLAWFLTRRIGYNRTFEVLAESQKLTAARCVELGIANRSVAADTLAETTAKWADDMAQRAPIALALTKRAARLSMSTGLSDALTLEAELQTVCASTEDSREAIAAFREKRSPTFQGR